jgi:uncharacterized protein DUF1990
MRVRARALNPAERAFGWLVGVPVATWRYISRETEVHREEGTCSWPIEGFPEEDYSYHGEPATLQRPSAGRGAAFRRRYSGRVKHPVLSACEVMSLVLTDPNVASPLEIARFEREDDDRKPLEVGEEMRVRLPGPWNGPVRVIDVSDRSFRLATLRGHMEAGEIEFRARDEANSLLFEIESWGRSSNLIFDVLYDRLRIARELQADMWMFFLERMAQISGGTDREISVFTQRCDHHPFSS